jgi:hypothetical protein
MKKSFAFALRPPLSCVLGAGMVDARGTCHCQSHQDSNRKIVSFHSL